MRNLTELLQEIPLDEMTGGLNNMKMTDNNEKTITVNNSGARIRSKAPAAVAVAACAVAAVIGSVQMSNNKFESGASVNDSHADVVEDAVTDAEDTSASVSPELIGLSDEEMNSKLSRIPYDENGYDYELVKDNINVLNEKLGTVKEGFENFDIRVADIKMSYPFIEIDIAVSTLDGSNIYRRGEDPIFSRFPDVKTIKVFPSCTIDGIDYGNIRSALDYYGDTAISRQVIDLTLIKNSGREPLNSESVIHYEFSQLFDSDYTDDFSTGLFSVDIPIGEFVDVNDTSPWSNSVRPDAKGVMEYEDLYSTDKIKLDYTVNEVDWSSSGLAVNISPDNKSENFDAFIMTVDLFGNQLDLAKCNEFYRTCDENTDVFVDVDFMDGKTEKLNVTDTSYSENEDGSITLYYNTLTTPYNYDEVAALHFGSVVVPVEHVKSADGDKASAEQQAADEAAE